MIVLYLIIYNNFYNMLSKNLLEQIQKDLECFDRLPIAQQEKLVSSLTKSEIAHTDYLFEILGKKEDIWEIHSNIDEIIPFLFRMWNFIISKNEINIEMLVERLNFDNNLTKNNLILLFNKDSTFLNSIECENISNENIDSIEDYISNNLLSEIKYSQFYINSKINIKTKNKNIELILDLEQLEILKNNIEENIKQLGNFKESFKNSNLKIFK